MELVVIGSSNMDLVIYVPKIPAIGETILGSKSESVFGGKGANQAVAAIRAGAAIQFISKIGNDIYGEKMRSHFVGEGFSQNGILVDGSEPSGIAQILVSDRGENTIAVAPGANMHLSSEDIKSFEKEIAKATIVLIQLEIPLQTVVTIVEIAYSNNTKVILNPAPAQNLAKNILNKIWLLTPNETEAKLLTGVEVIDSESTLQAAKILLEKGIQNVIITMGERGCFYANHEEYEYFPAFNEVAIDTTAAGDVFNGVLASSLTQNNTIAQGIRFASAAAAISVTRKGAQPSIPTLDEINSYLSDKMN